MKVKEVYINQIDKFSCAPIAIMNALEWVGRRYSYDLEWIRRICKCYEEGTYIRHLDSAVYFFGLSGRRCLNPSLRVINSELDKGNAILLTYFRLQGETNAGHSMLCVGYTPHHYKVINYFRRSNPVQQVAKKRFKYLLSQNQWYQPKSIVYFLEKNNER